MMKWTRCLQWCGCRLKRIKISGYDLNGDICEEDNLLEDVPEDEELVDWCLSWLKVGGGWKYL
jgi:hypothetical protein